MKNISALVVVLSFLALLPAAVSYAQQGMGLQGKGGRGASYSRLFDPRTVETIKGEVVSVGKEPSARRTGSAVYLVLKTDKETIPVHVGLESYVEKQSTRIESGDRIEVKGSRVRVEGKPSMVAAEIKKGSETLKLRDGNGATAWSSCKWP